ncbi:hypothetical protein CEP52_005614 [Fusarium oligoseptatum]|uniref:Uncharacterized protein n=1 Tax=Fusarium oligoseptatum TaxID=2604345 RepID=A0A428TXI7_9HYPO|nr:hypothetical protein CEP52_005614 [Fusarium oligoseptatum]
MAIEQKDIFQFRSWSDLVQEYSTLQLKYESDRLPALAGIADIGYGKPTSLLDFFGTLRSTQQSSQA